MLFNTIFTINLMKLFSEREGEREREFLNSLHTRTGNTFL